MGADDAVLGVDGCPGGWVGALVRGSAVTWHVGSLASLLRLPAAVVAIDIPLALPVDGTRRACEVAAKACLGAARTPITLLAAICSPLPEPPRTMPRLPGSATVASAAAKQNGG